MSFINMEYFLFIAVGIFVYYVMPKKFQWVVLLVMSYVYYLSFRVEAVVYIIFTTLVTFAAGLLIHRVDCRGKEWLAANKENISRNEKKAFKDKLKSKKKLIMLIALVTDFAPLAFVKYTNFLIENINKIAGDRISLLGILVPIGISFYTFQSVGYLLDVYWGKVEPCRNPFKFALFVSFFPQIMQGPIGRFGSLAPQLMAPHRFDLTQVEFGLQRVFWGIFKKLILADRTSVYVYEVFVNNYQYYNGFFVIVGLLMYSVQLYADFSGGIDIVIGTAQMFGIRMDENFRQPFFSKSIGEFWRRWHITLGTWMKDIAYGLFNGFIIAFSNLCKPLYKKGLDKCHINGDGRAWTIFKIFRTFILVNIGWYFDMAVSLRAAFEMMINTLYQISFKPFIDGSIFTLGMGKRDFAIVAAGCLIWFVISLMQERGIKVREAVAKLVLPVRWAIYLALIFIPVLIGYVGETQGFIYAQF